MVKVKGESGKTRYTIKPLDAELSFDKGFYVRQRESTSPLGSPHPFPL